MVAKILQAEATQESTRPAVTSLQEMAETIQMDSLQYAHTKFTQPMRAAGFEEVLQRHDFISYFKLGMAQRIANTLAAHDDQVREIHYFDPNLSSDSEIEAYAPLDPSVNLLVVVESKSAALDSFIAALDMALTQEARKLPSPLFASLTSILNAMIITEGDVDQKRGYAALLSSMYLKPLQVW